MRRLKSLTLAVLITVLSAGFVAAQDLSEILENDNGRYKTHLIESEYAKYKLVYPVKRSENVTVKIYDTENVLVYSERLKNINGFTRSYDFRNLPDGNYRFEIWSAKGSVKREVVHKHKSDDMRVFLDKTSEDKTYRLIVKGVKERPVYIDIYNNKNDLVYEDIVKIGKDFSREYLLKIPLGNEVKFSITHDKNNIVKTVK